RTCTSDASIDSTFAHYSASDPSPRPGLAQRRVAVGELVSPRLELAWLGGAGAAARTGAFCRPAASHLPVGLAGGTRLLRCCDPVDPCGRLSHVCDLDFPILLRLAVLSGAGVFIALSGSPDPVAAARDGTGRVDRAGAIPCPLSPGRLPLVL